jgi:hypothetical protein
MTSLTNKGDNLKTKEIAMFYTPKRVRDAMAGKKVVKKSSKTAPVEGSKKEESKDTKKSKS